MPLPNWCRELDPGDWMRMCLEPEGHEGPHGYKTHVDKCIRGEIVKRTVEVHWGNDLKPDHA